MAESQSKNKVNLKIDCSRLSKKEITALKDSLEKYVNVIVAGWSLIEGAPHTRDFSRE